MCHRIARCGANPHMNPNPDLTPTPILCDPDPDPEPNFHIASTLALFLHLSPLPSIITLSPALTNLTNQMPAADENRAMMDPFAALAREMGVELQSPQEVRERRQVT